MNITHELNKPTLCKYAQVIPNEMMVVLKEAAMQKGLDLDIEVAVRLVATMVVPEAFDHDILFNQIINQDITLKEAVAECEDNRKRWLYVYEVEKLRLFLSFTGKVPRGMKENFMLIDVKAETKRILAEIAAKKKKEEE